MESFSLTESDFAVEDVEKPPEMDDETNHRAEDKDKDVSVHGDYRCDCCNFTAFTMLEVGQHIIEEHKEEFTCSICDFVASANHILKSHKLGKHNESCKKCPHMRFTVGSLSTHLKMVHGEDKTKTGKTRKTPLLKVQLALGVHINVTHDREDEKNKGELICKLCGYQSTTFRMHDRHQGAPHNLTCNKCPFLKFTPPSCIQHKLRGHEQEGLLYRCNHCDYTRPKVHLVAKHTKSVHGVHGDFRCEFCNFTAFAKPEVAQHNREKHREEFTCSICDFVASHKTALKSHKKGKHSEICKQCPGLRFTDGSLIKHQEIVHGKLKEFLLPPVKKNELDLNSKPKIPCDHCDYIASSTGQLIRHKRLSHEKVEQNLQCKLCPYKARFQLALDVHQKVTHDVKTPTALSITCEHCNYVCRSEATLSAHKKAAHGIENVYRCEHCSYSNVKKTMVMKHAKNVHIVALTCHMCHHVAVTMKMLKGHLELDHGLMCEHCPSMKFTNFSLVLHKKAMHRKAGVIMCSLCHFTTPQEAAMIHHRKVVHSVKAFFKCDYCEFSSTRKADVTKHERDVHSEEFLCSICGHQLNTKFNLVLHQRQRHTYKCKHCPEMKFTLGSLAKHKEIVHQYVAKTRNVHGRPLISSKKSDKILCNQCDFIASSIGQMSRHERRTGHQGVDSYLCGLCPYSDQTRDALNAHERVQHGFSVKKEDWEEPVVKIQVIEDHAEHAFTNDIGQEEHLFDNPLEGDGDEEDWKCEPMEMGEEAAVEEIKENLTYVNNADSDHEHANVMVKTEDLDWEPGPLWQDVGNIHPESILPD